MWIQYYRGPISFFNSFRILLFLFIMYHFQMISTATDFSSQPPHTTSATKRSVADVTDERRLMSCRRALPKTRLPLSVNDADSEDLTYTALDTWRSQPTSRKLVAGLGTRRERYGWESDFPDFKLPFLNNVMVKSASLGGVS